MASRQDQQIDQAIADGTQQAEEEAIRTRKRRDEVAQLTNKVIAKLELIETKVPGFSITRRENDGNFVALWLSTGHSCAGNDGISGLFITHNQIEVVSGKKTDTGLVSTKKPATEEEIDAIILDVAKKAGIDKRIADLAAEKANEQPATAPPQRSTKQEEQAIDKAVSAGFKRADEEASREQKYQDQVNQAADKVIAQLDFLKAKGIGFDYTKQENEIGRYFVSISLSTWKRIEGDAGIHEPGASQLIIDNKTISLGVNSFTWGGRESIDKPATEQGITEIMDVIGRKAGIDKKLADIADEQQAAIAAQEPARAPGLAERFKERVKHPFRSSSSIQADQPAPAKTSIRKSFDQEIEDQAATITKAASAEQRALDQGSKANITKLAQYIAAGDYQEYPDVSPAKAVQAKPGTQANRPKTTP